MKHRNYDPIPIRIALGAFGGRGGYIRVGGGLRPFWGDSGGKGKGSIYIPQAGILF